jgi:hypothetical protein
VDQLAGYVVVPEHSRYVVVPEHSQ